MSEIVPFGKYKGQPIEALAERRRAVAEAQCCDPEIKPVRLLDGLGWEPVPAVADFPLGHRTAIGTASVSFEQGNVIGLLLKSTYFFSRVPSGT
jgi:hypothetical protein